MADRTDALDALLAAEQATDGPMAGTVDRGWARLASSLPDGPDGSGGPDDSGGPDEAGPDGPADIGPPSAGAATTSVGIAAKVAGVVAAAAVVAVVAVSGKTEPQPPHDPSPAVTPSLAADEAPAAPVSQPSTPPTAVAPPSVPEPRDPPPPRAAELPPKAPESKSRKRKAPLPDVPGEGLEHELALLKQAQQELAANRPRRALRWLRQHAETHPNGHLAEEREAARAIAGCMQTPSTAKLKSFTSRWPQSTHLVRVQDACKPE